MQEEIRKNVQDTSHLVTSLATSTLPVPAGKSSHRVLVFPLRGRSLGSMHVNRILPMSTRMSAARQLLKALESLHSAGIVHRVLYLRDEPVPAAIRLKYILNMKIAGNAVLVSSSYPYLEVHTGQKCIASTSQQPSDTDTADILRPKWRELYAARRRLRTAASRLPELPDTLFGWIPIVHKISDDEVLASAGLDAFVDHKDDPQKSKANPTYLWMHVVFAYIFTGIGISFLIDHTNKIIQIRQQWLGAQTTLTDRTLRLSGIPPELRSEEKITQCIEQFQIGKVDQVMLCRDWSELDGLMEARKNILQKLEEAWTKHVGYRWQRSDTRGIALPLVQTDRMAATFDSNENSERSRLLSAEESARAHVSSYNLKRPTTRIWYGPLNLRFKTIDAIDFYEEKLRQLDERIEEIRKKECEPIPLAFVTMESIAACQMAVQAILDPWPMQLVANLAPAPADVVWQHTYLSRRSRMLRGWSITLLIGVLTVFWSVLLIPLAYLLNLETIEKVIPSLADFLSRHAITKSLVQTGLPTLILSLMTIAVPFIYDWLGNLQGMTSQGDVELSLISKNFFFTFFNLFLVFTVFATASNFYRFFENLRDVLRDTTTIALALARSLETLAPFYTNLIVLQGLGLFPFRLLEFGSVFLYPFQRFSARTPRDYAGLDKPPTFSYGLALPQTILIFIITVVYSVFPSSYIVCLFGLIYFSIGRFIYKYQLLYAMDHQQHSTGRAWPMICSRRYAPSTAPTLRLIRMKYSHLIQHFTRLHSGIEMLSLSASAVKTLRPS
ncbi:DUF221 domain-containing protein [Histoplasma capsulatum]|uniref:DUF221 domain-containing protein n=1 Tax=Ajellomyces capsulatus TaxID=5037 RepID=A0A8A1M2X4_AJECA|nr:DUF221 domain-containing protein [Histoplasma capsulatum]